MWLKTKTSQIFFKYIDGSLNHNFNKVGESTIGIHVRFRHSYLYQYNNANILSLNKVQEGVEN